MQNIDAALLATVTGGNDTLTKVGNWLQQRYYDVREGAALAHASMGIDEFHPPTPATFAKYNELRQAHGRPVAPAPQ